MGFLVEVESEPLTGGEVSKGEAKVETTGMELGDEQLNSMELGFQVIPANGYGENFDGLKKFQVWVFLCEICFVI